jgi:o-succinylbenzoate synthase
VKIDSVRLRELRVPLASPFETSKWREEEKTCIIVELNGNKQTGYAECPVSKGPFYGYENLASAWEIMEDYLVPSILGANIKDPSEVLEKSSHIRGHNMAKASLEMATWDLMAKDEGKSLSQMLGGESQNISSGVSIGLQKTPEDLVDTVEKYVEQGYRRIKVKIKPGRDHELVSAVREDYPDTPLMVDGNGAYAPEDSESLVQLDTFDLLMIEQPYDWDDLVEHAKLGKRLKTPICLDESVASLNDLRSAIALESCKILNIKPARVGGFTEAKAIHDVCRGQGIPVWCGGLLETGIGRAHNVALASLPGFTMPGDISASERYFKEDLVKPTFKLNPDGTITVPTGPGIGVEVLEDKLEEYTVKKKLFKA